MNPLLQITARKILSPAAGVLLTGLLSLHESLAQELTRVDINNSIPGVVTRTGSEIRIEAGGGDTYGTADSFTYLYEQRTGDFDVRVQVLNVDADDPADVQKSAKATLHVRASLDPGAPDIQVNATPLAGVHYVETIARPQAGGDTLDPPENNVEFRTYGGPWPGTYSPGGVLTYPLWLRLKRQGNLFQTMASQDAVTWSTLAEYSMDSSSFPATLYVGLGAVAHVNPGQNTALRVRSTFTGYGDTPSPPAANSGGFQPGPFPNKTVTGVNWNVSLPADGIGYTPDKTQSGQIIWNNGGFDTIHRDILVDIGAQGPVPFSIGRYGAGALDFALSPFDAAAARGNLGTGPNRNRSLSDPSNPPAQAWFPSPREGVLLPVLRKNGPIQWNDGAPPFYPHVYQAIDFSSAQYFSMDTGLFGNGAVYTRMAKRGNTALPAAAGGVYQRSAVDFSVAWFPYSQGWKAGSFEDSTDGGKAAWTYPASHSAAATENTFSLTTNPQSSAEALLTWIDPSFTGLAELGFPSVNAAADGMLFLVGNNDGSSTMRGPQANCAIKAGGTAWTVAIRDVEENRADPATYAQAASTEFSFVYIPYTAGNLIGGQVSGGTGAAANSKGTFTLTRTVAGEYALTIPGKTANSGMLILQPVGTLPENPSIVDRVTMSYEPAADGNSFVIQSRGVSSGTVDGGQDGFPLQDSDFYFAWVDFTAPLTPAPSVPEALPVLDITRGAGNTVVVSWPAAVTGYTLESSTSLSAPWAVVPGVSNNTVTLTLSEATPRLFLRLKK